MDGVGGDGSPLANSINQVLLERTVVVGDDGDGESTVTPLANSINQVLLERTVVVGDVGDGESTMTPLANSINQVLLERTVVVGDVGEGESTMTPLANCINQVLLERTMVVGVTLWAKWKSDFLRTFLYYLDRSAPHLVYRWIGTLVVATIYGLRMYFIQGSYIVSWALGIYILNLLIEFLSLKVLEEGVSLPTEGSDEFNPFLRNLLEFKLWYSITKAFCIAFPMTFFLVFDAPVFGPILMCYWIVLIVLMIKRLSESVATVH